MQGIDRPRMGRRDVIGTLLALGVIVPIGARAQQAPALRRIGFLGLGSMDSESARIVRRQIVDALRRQGYEDGRNLAIEWRYAEGRIDRAGPLAEELVRANVELILAVQVDGVAALKKATTTIPIVMISVADPVQRGLVPSLQGSGMNVTGSARAEEAEAQQAILALKEAKPDAKRIAVLLDMAKSNSPRYVDNARRALSGSGITVEVFSASRPEEVPPALERMAAFRPDALYVNFDAPIIPRMKEVTAFMLDQKVLTTTFGTTLGETGTVAFSVGVPNSVLIELGIGQADRVLRGANAAELPIVLATKYETIINAKVARAIEWEIPAAMRARADRIID